MTTTTATFAWAVTSLPRLRKDASAFRPTHLVSLLDRGDRARRPSSVPASHHLQLFMVDTDHPDSPDGPQDDHVARLLAFTGSLSATDRLMVHCQAGISRSTAAMLAVLVQHQAFPDVSAALTALVLHRPVARPNLQLVRLAAARLDVPDLVVAVTRLSEKPPACDLL